MRASFMIHLAFAGGLLALVHIGPAAAAGFECDWRTAADEPAGAHDITSILPAGDVLDDPARPNGAISKLRNQRLSKALIIDNLIGAYCPVVAKDNALSDSKKVVRMQRFAGAVTRLVYQVEGETEVILNVPLPPGIVDRIQSKASEQNISVESWVADTVESALDAALRDAGGSQVNSLRDAQVPRIVGVFLKATRTD